MEEIIFKLIFFVAGGFSGFFASYFKKKGDNIALLEDMRRLEEEKRNVEKHFTLEIESVKKDYQLDIERRKYQYEEKIQVYANFCSDLDLYQSKEQDILKEKAMPIINQFLQKIKIPHESFNENNQAFSEYFSNMILLCNELNLAYATLKNQSNKLRLITSAESDILLDELLLNLKASTDISNSLILLLATPEGMQNENKKNEHITALLNLDVENKALRHTLIRQMKVELESI